MKIERLISEGEKLEIWPYLERMRHEPIEENLRSHLEPYFNRTLRHVRIHTCSLAAASARMLNARAYALGEHVVFGEGEYNPATPEGQWLLAHEITHVVQHNVTNGRGAVGLGPLNSWSEAEADAAATAFVMGWPAPRISSEQDANTWIIRRKGLSVCPGQPIFETINAKAKEVYHPANQAIEADYLRAHASHAEAIFFGSQFMPFRDVRLPRGAPNQRFGNLLLEKLRGISQQLQPDIIDFKERTFYEIKSEAYALEKRSEVSYQLKHYYDLTEEILRAEGQHVEVPWKQDNAYWKPLPFLPFLNLNPDRFVCTAATDYEAWPLGLVLYDVRQRKKKEDQSKRAVKAISIVESDRDFAAVMPDRKRLSAAVCSFNPYLPDFVIVVPTPMYHTWKSSAYDERTRRLFEVKLPPILDTRTPIGQFHRIGWMMVGGSVGAFAAPVAGMILVDAFAFGVGTAAVATGAAGSGGGEVISLEAYKAMRASPAVVKALKAAGVLIVAGVAHHARADQVEIGEVTAVRLVPVEMFKPYKGRQAASNVGDVPGSFLQTEETIKGEFRVGTTVLYDWIPHVVVGRVRVEYL